MFPIDLKTVPRAILLALAAGATTVLLFAIAFHLWRGHRAAAAQARLDQARAGAAIASGHDAAGTIAAAAARDEAAREIVQEVTHDVQAAHDGHAVDTLGRDGLCRLAAYRGTAGCVQHADPR